MRNESADREASALQERIREMARRNQEVRDRALHESPEPALAEEGQRGFISERQALRERPKG